MDFFKETLYLFLPADVCALLVRGERGVAGHEEVESGRGDQRRDQPDQVVVHVAGVPQRRGGHGHNGRHKLINLSEGGVADVEPVRCNPDVMGEYTSSPKIFYIKNLNKK